MNSPKIQLDLHANKTCYTVQQHMLKVPITAIDALRHFETG